MEIFVLNDAVTHLELALPSSQGEARLTQLIELAWHLRQRNTNRALALADEAEACLSATKDYEPEHGQEYEPEHVHEPRPERQAAFFRARLQLIRAEAKWLHGDLDSSWQLVQAALAGFTAQQDAIGISDAHWVLAAIETDRGNMEQQCQALL
ncbi:MAG: hypothetical protein RL748_1057, partial [Pseudomonadota bacterium]